MRAFLTAAVSVAEAEWLAARVHYAGQVPANPVTPYLTVSIDAGLPDVYLNSAQHGARTFRVAVQCVGATIQECAFAAEKADATFLDRRLAVTGWSVGPALCEVPASPRRDPDGGGLMYALATYRFTAIEEDES